MDHQRDYPLFERLMARLCETMSKPITDELVESWWKSLRTVQFDEVERRMQSFIARSTDTTRFPRPGQFRPENVAPAMDPKDEARERRISEDGARNWRAFIARYPKTGPIRYQIALAARITATEPMDSPAYAEALEEERHLIKQLGEFGQYCADC